MNEPRYNIGDVIYIGKWEAYEIHESCPDCGGTLKIKVILFDGTEYLIDCEGCKRGWQGPTGYVRRNGFRATVTEAIIQGIELGCWSDNKGQWTYQVGLEDGYTCRSHILESQIFVTEQDALNFAIAKGKQLEIEDAARVFLKDKPDKTWAWNVTYHRREIKRAQRDLEYHTRKLEAAKNKVKEESDKKIGVLR
jgi:hypothetical protein